MQVTDAMLQAAVRKAVEVQLLPEGAELLSDCRLRNIIAVVEAALAEADEECESRLDRARAAYDALREAIEIEQDRALIAESERDAIARLCYRKVETEDLDRETYYRLAILHLCLGPETYDTEPEAVAAVRRLAGLDAAPAVPEPPEPPEDTDLYCPNCGNDDPKRLACIDNYANGTRWRCEDCGHKFLTGPREPEERRPS
jgi:predicted RNA-binding Zn-ribbon protein involved in translation (DUF1610 family)